MLILRILLIHNSGLYNPGEANSVTILGQLIEVCRTFGIEIVTQTTSRTSEIAQATAKLASSVDAIFINNDKHSTKLNQNHHLCFCKAKCSCICE